MFDLSEIGEEGFAKAESIRTEYVLAVRGVPRKHDADRVNPVRKRAPSRCSRKNFAYFPKQKTPPFRIDEAASVNDRYRL